VTRVKCDTSLLICGTCLTVVVSLAFGKDTFQEGSLLYMHYEKTLRHTTTDTAHPATHTATHCNTHCNQKTLGYALRLGCEFGTGRWFPILIVYRVILEGWSQILAWTKLFRHGFEHSCSAMARPKMGEKAKQHDEIKQT